MPWKLLILTNHYHTYSPVIRLLQFSPVVVEQSPRVPLMTEGYKLFLDSTRSSSANRPPARRRKDGDQSRAMISDHCSQSLRV